VYIVVSKATTGFLECIASWTSSDMFKKPLSVVIARYVCRGSVEMIRLGLHLMELLPRVRESIFGYLKGTIENLLIECCPNSGMEWRDGSSPVIGQRDCYNLPSKLRKTHFHSHKTPFSQENDETLGQILETTAVKIGHETKSSVLE
jgi:hypothetical protein